MSILKIVVFSLVSIFFVESVSFCGDCVEKARRTGVFSSLRYHPESGDLLGAEIIIVPSGSGMHAIIQIAEGRPIVPLVARIIFKKGGNQFEIFLPDNKFYSGYKIVGCVLTDRLDAKMISPRGVENNLNLERKKSYWSQSSAALIEWRDFNG